MKDANHLSRRRFVQLGTLATTAVFLPGQLRAASAADEIGSALPPLNYDYAALEPHMDAATMRLHHDKHHAAYLSKLQEVLPKLPALKGQSLGDALSNLKSIDDEALRTTVRNQGGGDWNHRFFWNTLAPASKSGKPGEKLAKAIDESFGSHEKFQATFNEAATKRFGSGWAWLIAKDGKLKVVSTANQDNPLMKGIVDDKDLGTPILALDVWEHAYYLHYQNRRADYITAWWNIVNWTEADKRLAAAG